MNTLSTEIIQPLKKEEDKHPAPRPIYPSQVAVDQQKAVAELQLATFMAKQNPRDIPSIQNKLKIDAYRKGVAEGSAYSYKRGGVEITGPTIRIAELIAQRWGNLQYGLKELERNYKDKWSKMRAFVIDLETNLHFSMDFEVPWSRMAHGQVVDVVDPRDIYEIVSNAGARRLRACILKVIPSDIVDDLMEECHKAMSNAAKEELAPDRIQKLVAAFDAFGVKKINLEKRVERKLDDLDMPMLIRLRKIYKSIQEGATTPEDWFPELAKSEEKKSQSSKVEGLKAKLGAIKPSPSPSPGAPEVPTPPYVPEPPPEEKVNLIFNCPICSFSSASERGLKKHMTQSHSEPEMPKQASIVDFGDGEDTTSN